MNQKLAQMIKKHIGIIKEMYPEVYIEVKMIYDDILIGIDSLEISNKKEYESLMYSFIKEYDKKGFFYVYWGVNSSLTKDNLLLLENPVKKPMKKIAVPKKNQKAVSPKPQMRGQL